MKIILLLILFVIQSTFAQEQSCEVVPKRPVVGEQFQLVCRVQVTNESSVDVTFEKRGIEVLRRKKIDAAIRSTVKNGQIYTFKEEKYVFDLIAGKSGRKKIYNLTVYAGDRKTKHRDISFYVDATRRVPKKIFAEAEFAKESIYVGEGIDVNYYLYYSVTRKAHIVEEWPKIKNFYKREINLLGNEVAEMVAIEGQMYHKLLLYSHRLFPDHPGTFDVGTIKVNFEYVGTKSYGLLGNFNSIKKKIVRSDKKTIQVLALPAKNAPKNFSGLVGKHHFKIELSKEKYLVNEPIEAKLVVVGEGNLEQFAAPVIFEHENIEEFDQSGEITKDEKGLFRKVIGYTYLARLPLEIPKRTVRVSFFDLEQKKYVSQKLKVPSLKVYGAVAPVANDGKKTKGVEKNVIPIERLVAPIFREQKISLHAILYLNVLFGFLIFFVMVSFVDWKDKMPGVDDRLANACRMVKSKKGGYSSVFNLLTFLKTPVDMANIPLREVVKSSGLSKDAKEYFCGLVDLSEKEAFDKKENENKFKYRKKYFKEYIAYVTRKLGDENNKQH